MEWASLIVLLPAILPIVGKVLLMASFVPNKLIPFINAAIATLAKYWMLAGFGVLGDATTAPPGTAAPADSLAMAGIGAFVGMKALALAWGCLDSAMAHYFYEGKKAQAAIKGETSWWEKGKKSIY